jgi:hypothetical protein
MEQLFIKNILNQDLFNKLPNIKLNGLLNYYDTKEEIIFYDTDYKINIDYDKNDLEEDDVKEIDDYLKEIISEITKIKKVMEYFIVNLQINKLHIPFYKIYDYSHIPNNLKSKIKPHNHIFDIKKFLVKNGIQKDELMKSIKILLDKDELFMNMNETKLMTFFILIKIIEIFNIYNKCLLYSIELIKEQPIVIKNKMDNLVKIDKNNFVINNDIIEINHHNLIKNAYAKNNKNDKKTTTVSITSSSKIVFNKNNEILFN